MKIKQILSIFFLLISICAAFAQIPIKTEDEKINLNLYAGALSIPVLSIDSLSLNPYLSARIGMLMAWEINPYIDLKLQGVSQSENGFNNKVWSTVLMVIKPTKKLNVQFGFLPTLACEQRPSPNSADGQFETWTQSQIPGSAFGIKAKYSLTEKIKIGGGVSCKNKRPEYQVKAELCQNALSVFYEEGSKRFGLILTSNSGPISETFVFRSDSLLGNTLAVSLNRGYLIYNDLGYSLAKKSLVRGEIGILKKIKSRYFKGLFGPGYCYESRSIAFTLFIHI
ncbi:MAG: hypothetical protein WC545_00660 [Patescibacteria group bacterium]|jgi:hypothetical protein